MKTYRTSSIVFALLSLVLTWVIFIGRINAVEQPTGVIAGEHVIMPGMTKDKVVSITGIHSGMEKATISTSKSTFEIWYLYFDGINKKWLVIPCERYVAPTINQCEYWEITFVEQKVTSVRVLTKSQ